MNNKERPRPMSGEERKRLEDECLLLELVERRALAAAALSKTLLIANDDMPQALGIGKTKWQEMKKNGTAPPCVRVAGRDLYRPDDLMKWIAALRPVAACVDDEDHDGKSASPPTPDCSYLQHGLHAAPR